MSSELSEEGGDVSGRKSEFRKAAFELSLDSSRGGVMELEEEQPSISAVDEGKPSSKRFVARGNIQPMHFTQNQGVSTDLRRS